MILANVIFAGRRRSDPDQPEDFAEGYLGAMFHAGHLCAEYCLILTRYWGRPKGEDQRLCPGCRNPWRAERLQESPGRFWQSDFQCDRCRLVSHVAVSTDGGRHARIGEFDEKRKANGFDRFVKVEKA
jgi:hypothetical protein